MRRAGRTPAMQQAGKNYPRAKRTRRSLRREPVLAARALIPKSSLITASRGGQHFPLKYYRYGKEREYPRFLENATVGLRLAVCWFNLKQRAINSFTSHVHEIYYKSSAYLVVYSP